MATTRPRKPAKRNPAKRAPVPRARVAPPTPAGEPMVSARAVSKVLEATTQRVQQATVEAMQRELGLLRALVASQAEVIAALKAGQVDVDS